MILLDCFDRSIEANSAVVYTASGVPALVLSAKSTDPLFFLTISADAFTPWIAHACFGTEVATLL
jgi:hypothetical protein